VLSGRLGAERYPPSTEPALDVAVTRALRAIDPGVTLGWVQDVIALVDDADVLRAKVAVEVTRPQDVKAFFRATLRNAVRAVAPVASAPTPAMPLKTAPDDDPYGF
jgi:hypothetical protein